jgi:hypothetical protein
MFRTLLASEIDVRVQSYIENSKGAVLLLYKDARCDMNILDETVGAFNWQRSHTRDNANCIVSIYNNDTGEWVSKEDTGTESMSDKEKGLASDSFKRACFNWGIGRELYTSPFIWVNIDDNETVVRNGKKAIKSSVKFYVKEITYNNDKTINDLVIVDGNDKVRFSNKITTTRKKAETKKETNDLITDEQIDFINNNFDEARLLSMYNYYKISSITEMTYADAVNTINGIKRAKSK